MIDLLYRIDGNGIDPDPGEGADDPTGVLPLRPVPSQAWQNEFDTLIDDPYLASKYHRKRRIAEKSRYVDSLAPEIRAGTARVLDIGPGPGEFLEVARFYGCLVLGIDSAPGESEMGSEYWRLSRLMALRQQLPVWYIGMDRLLAQPYLPFADRAFTILNSQGSIEQVFRSHLTGPPHRDTKNASLLAWTLDSRMAAAFDHFLAEAHRILDREGILLIYGNGAANADEYDCFLRSEIDRLNLFDLTMCENSRLHRMVKRG